MAKIRHIATRAENVEEMAQFFVQAFGLELVQRRGHGPIDLSDGDVNITVLPMNVGNTNYEIRPGVEHIGFSVENDDATKEQLTKLGATEMSPVRLGDVYYESKFRGPENLIIDVGHWRGARPVEAPAGVE
jgi:catechol 2,3-dioxygenase-like lactoylglutathione lyase family enzyme